MDRHALCDARKGRRMTYAGLMALPAMVLFALVYAPGAALILAIGCAQLLFDGVANWRHAKKHARQVGNMPPSRVGERGAERGAECGAPEGAAPGGRHMTAENWR